MFTRTRLAAVVVAVVAFAAVPSIASAAAPQLRGVVSGSPYGASNGSMAIPVLFSKMTVRSAGLKSPVGVIIMKRTQKVALPGGASSLPVNLRTGDRFKGSGVVSDVNKRTFYPRVPMGKGTVVYFRSKEMSLAELTAAVEALRKALADLNSKVIDLQKYTFAGFQQLLAEIDALKKQLAALKIPAGVDLTSLQSQIDALKKQLDGLQILTTTDVTNLIDASTTIQQLKDRLNTICSSLDQATVTIDPDGPGGILPAVVAPVDLPGIVAACP